MEQRIMIEAILLVAIVLATLSGVKFYRHPRPPAEYKQLSDMVVTLSGEVSRLSVRLCDMETLLDKYERGIQKLIEQIRGAGLVPSWEPNGDLQNLKSGRSPYTRVFNEMMTHFSEEELANVAFQLGTGLDDLDGETRPGRIQALVEWAGRTDKGDELLAIVKRERPTADWPKKL